MNSIGDMLKAQLKVKRRSQSWLAKAVGIKRVTFALKMKRDRFTAVELIMIAKVLELDLNIFKPLVPEPMDFMDALPFPSQSDAIKF